MWGLLAVETLRPRRKNAAPSSRCESYHEHLTALAQLRLASYRASPIRIRSVTTGQSQPSALPPPAAARLGGTG